MTVYMLAPPSVETSLDEHVPELPMPMYKRCLCLGVQAGRSCQLCFGLSWLKMCLDCFGSGLVFSNVRSGAAPRSSRCGFCAGKGWTGAKPADAAAIQQQEAGVQAVKQVAVEKLQQQAGLVGTGKRGSAAAAGKAPRAGRRKTAAGVRRGRKPSAESLAKLAARTGGGAADLAPVTVTSAGYAPDAVLNPAPEVLA